MAVTVPRYLRTWCQTAATSQPRRTRDGGGVRAAEQSPRVQQRDRVNVQGTTASIRLRAVIKQRARTACHEGQGQRASISKPQPSPAS